MKKSKLCDKCGVSRSTLAVIGGGSAGLAAAVFAAEFAEKSGADVRICVFESNPRVGKKLLVTGNGRCNFTNADMSPSHFHGDTLLAEKALDAFSSEQTVRFFENGGLFSRKDRAGRIYPLSNQASSVLDFFRNEVRRHGIEIFTERKVTSVKKTGKGFLLNGEFAADAVIVACGGRAAPVHGSDGSFFSVLRGFGVTATEMFPALTPLCIADFTKALKGIRAEGKLTVKHNGRIAASECGELQYTDYGISGIPAMQVSGRVAPLLKESAPTYVCVDSAPTVEADELKKYILKMLQTDPDRPIEMLLSGIMPKRLAVFLLAELSFRQDKTLRLVNPSAADRIVSAVKNKKYTVSGVKDFADAQVTVGGIPAAEINCETLELKKVKNMYVCGEAVNVDGDCGGYNLQWAWSSAYVAASSAVGELINAQDK